MIRKIFVNKNQLATQNQSRNQLTPGFTLIELLVVFAILAIITSLGLANFVNSQKKARDAQRKSDLASLSKAVEMYYNDRGGYPPDDGAGQIQGTTWGDNAGFYYNTTIYLSKMPKDPSAYNYYYVRADSSSYRLYAKLENDKDKNIITPVVSTNCSPEAARFVDNCNYGISSANIKP